MKLLRRDVFHVAAIVILVSMTAVSCNQIEDDLLPDNEIRLNASVASNVIATKGAGVVSSDTSDPLYMGFVRIDETASGYPVNFTGQSALTATMQGDGNVKDINFNESYQTFADERSGVKYASWYPWYENAADEDDGDYKYDKDKATVTFPIDGSTDILYGSVATGTKVKGFNTIEYNHALVKYRILAYAMVPYDETGKPIDSYMPDVLWGKIKTVTIEQMPPKCVLTLPESDGSEYGLTWPYEDAKSDLIDYTHGSGAEGEEILNSIPITMDEAAVLTEFIAAPPVDGILKIGVTTSKTQATQEITIARDFKPGRHYDVRLRFSNHGLINAEVEASEWGTGEDIDFETGGNVFFDLSTDATANSYMVAPSNYNYCFDVTVKGNGSRGVLDGTDHSLNPGWVDVVWMDKGLADNFRLSSHYPSLGRALFELNNNTSVNNTSEVTYDDILEGNVLIGAYTEEGGDLLWTWHIWVCDRPQIQSYKNGFTVQDRDLGAVDYEPSDGDVTKVDGLYYQWGRPTPFPVGRDLQGDFNITSDSSVPDVLTAIANPAVFYDDAVVAVAGSNTAKLWGWRSDAEEYVKTIYDPCPPGYRVPSRRLWAELKANNYEIESHNVKFSVIEDYFIYYPISGYYNGPEGELKYYWDGTAERTEKVGAFMWSATYDAASRDNPYLMTYEYQKDGSHGMMTRPANDDGPALPVRCVAERSTPHVEDLSAFQTANSYIVDEEGYYKFDVTVRGNGVGYLVSPGSAETIDVTEGLSMKIDVDHVDFLWWQGDMETGNAISEPPVVLDFDGKPDNDGYITFHVDNFREGNLILAGYDAKGVILWTWHLWLTDTPALKKSGEYVVMDRFLGATYAPSQTAVDDVLNSLTDDPQQWIATFGFYYQWGRKDPFPAVATSGGDTEWWEYNGTEWVPSNTIKQALAAGRSVMESVAEPMVFHTSEKSDYPSPLGVSSASWNSYFTKNLNSQNRCYGKMVNEFSAENLWGYSSASGLGKTTSKTIYDPCPPGYSVAYYSAWAGSSSSYTWFDGWAYPLDDNYPEKVIGKGLLLNASRFSSKYDATWYPYSGYIDSYTVTYKELGEVGRFYSSTPAGNGARSFFYDDSDTGQAVYVDYSDNNAVIGIATTFALPIRCQKD